MIMDQFTLGRARFYDSDCIYRSNYTYRGAINVTLGARARVSLLGVNESGPIEEIIVIPVWLINRLGTLSYVAYLLELE